MYNAVVVYNEGEMGTLPIFRTLGLEQGAFMKVGFLSIDRNIFRFRLNCYPKAKNHGQILKHNLKEGLLRKKKYVTCYVILEKTCL